MTCGSRNYEDSHDDERNITVATLQRASTSGSVTMPDVLRHLREACEDMEKNGVPDHQSLGGAVNERLRPD